MKFKMPTKSDLRQRKSTIANAFAISIAPYIKPSNDEIKEVYNILQIDENQCAYCLSVATEVDHFRPLVEKCLPSGFITDYRNLVPCCSACNKSKGNKYWKDWYLSDDNIKILKSKSLSDEQIQLRYNCLQNFENLTKEKLNYERILGKDKWQEFLYRKERLNNLLYEDQKFCDELSLEILDYIKKREGDS